MTKYQAQWGFSLFFTEVLRGLGCNPQPPPPPPPPPVVTPLIITINRVARGFTFTKRIGVDSKRKKKTENMMLEATIFN